ncbi:MAG: hypothetical protein WC455_28120 [Dehalococcoidia bacterium]|jgi:hypothetical protein
MDWTEQHPCVTEGQIIVSSNEQKLSEQMLRPSYILKPKLFIDGDMWIAMSGENLMEGVCGTGKSPEEAYASFDKAWVENLQDRRSRE